MIAELRAAAWRLRYSASPPVRGVLRAMFGGKSARCPVCDSTLRQFLALPKMYARSAQRYGFPHAADEFETLNPGAYTCPVCGAADRERLMALYLLRLVSSGTTLADSSRIIDFAPSPPLSRFIQQTFPGAAYQKADLFQPGVDLRVDLCNMPGITTESIDLWICSHVLEHVEDDAAAVRELRRILRLGGCGLLLVPLLLTKPLLVPAEPVRTQAERWRYFGQGDHVRLYTKATFLALLNEAGLDVQQWAASTEFERAPEYFGVHAGSVLYVVRKRT